MLYSEFKDLFDGNYELSGDGYYEIEQSYYGFYGNKEMFCTILNDLLAHVDADTMIDAFLSTCFYGDNTDKILPYKYAVSSLNNKLEISCTSNLYYRFELSALIRKDRLNCATRLDWDVSIVEE